MQIDYQDISAEDFGKNLTGFGVNLLVRDVFRSCDFLCQVLGFEVLRQSPDYAILGHHQMLLQLHADHTYSENPLPSLLPENGARGAGIELRLYEVDPDQAEARAQAGQYVVLQSTLDKPHGLRECFLLDPDGYCWVPSAAK
ncbi:MAG: VOC family protein [Gammaproteobacteria bacterium]